MSTTELRNSIRSMGMEEQLVTMAVMVVLDRINRLTQADRDDLFELAKELSSASTEEDWIGIRDTMVEILDGKGASVEALNLGDANTPDRFKKWNEWVSKRIKEARAEARLTQEQLAEKSGLPQSHISRIENAKHSPSRATIEKLALALGKPIEFFDFN